jgi:hypothetical protein
MPEHVAVYRNQMSLAVGVAPESGQSTPGGNGEFSVPSVVACTVLNDVVPLTMGTAFAQESLAG